MPFGVLIYTEYCVTCDGVSGAQITLLQNATIIKIRWFKWQICKQWCQESYYKHNTVELMNNAILTIELLQMPLQVLGLHVGLPGVVVLPVVNAV